MTATPIRVGSKIELAASVPSLIGFRPSPGDLVAACFTRGRHTVAARIDMPTINVNALRALAATLRTAEPDQVEYFVYSESSDHARGLAELLGEILPLAGDVVRIDAAGFAYCECDRLECQVAALGNVDLMMTDIGLATMSIGMSVETSRDELAARLAYAGPTTAASETDRQLVVSWNWRLRDVEARDAELANLAAVDSDRLRVTLEQLLLTARHTQAGQHRDDVLAVAAVATWLLGDGAIANTCLAAISTEHTLGRLLGMALGAMMSPTVLRDFLGNL